MKCAVLMVGAGSGTRHGGDIPKQYQSLGDIPVFRRTLNTFCEHPQINSVHAIIAKDAAPLFAMAAHGLDVQSHVGGECRTASVRAGLAALADDPPDLVLIHDAARPFISADLISRLIAAASSTNGAAPGLAPSDALKKIVEHDQAAEDVARSGLAQVQTPQVFPFKPLYQIYTKLPSTADFADDIAVAQSGQLPCTIIEGEVENFKITRPGDLERAERLLRSPPTFASTPVCVTGTGFDVHRLVAGTTMMLCGIAIEGDLTLEGHSDADAGLHALTDALLGSIAAGDIGDHFPPDDPQWKGASSSLFLSAAHALLKQNGAKLLHVDVTLMCERPKIKPHREAMRGRLAELLALDIERVSIKATTTEKLGFLGRGEGLAALATASVQLKP